MSLRMIRGGTVVFFLLFVAAVTWPGMLPANRIFPLVLGLPFSMVWIAGWVLASCLVLLFLDRAEKGARDKASGEKRGGGGTPLDGSTGLASGEGE